jgi:peptidoglycan/LPS O-acetylase OafA/YrhL
MKSIFITKYGAIKYLDGWRGIAIILVLISHFSNIPGFREGRLGVDLFFVLSGLLMSQILFEKRTNLVTFYKRRISRIVPLFVFYASIVFMFSSNYSQAEVIGTFTFLRTYYPLEPHIWSSTVPIDHYWSLNVEEHCYLLMGLLSAFITDKRLASFILVLLGLITVMMNIHYTPDSPVEHELRTECASTGLLLSAGYYLIKDNLSWHIKPWMPIVVLFAAVLTYSEYFPWYTSFLSPFLLSFSINHFAQCYSVIIKFLSFTPLRFVGILSYSIYIWQQLFYKNINVLGDMSIFFVVGVSLVSFYLFESPIRRWLNNNW